MKKIFTILAASVLVLAMLPGCAESKARDTDTAPVSVTETTSVSVTENAEAVNSNIEIPGYESVEFKAGKEKQSSRFYNPEGNSCFFRMSLINGDEILWQSDYIEPGEKISKLKLNHALDAGEYAAKLKYECFTLNDKTPLNGAEIELKIDVR